MTNPVDAPETIVKKKKFNGRFLSEQNPWTHTERTGD
jgi:hypothetical protein